MNIFTKIKNVLGSSTAKPIVAAVTATLAGDLDKAIVAAKSTEIGTVAAAAIEAADVAGGTGAEKKAQAIAAVAPYVVLHVSKVGFAATIAEIEAFAGMVIESVLVDLKSTGLKTIAAAVLQLVLTAA